MSVQNSFVLLFSLHTWLYFQLLCFRSNCISVLKNKLVDWFSYGAVSITANSNAPFDFNKSGIWSKQHSLFWSHLEMGLNQNFRSFRDSKSKCEPTSNLANLENFQGICGISLTRNFQEGARWASAWEVFGTGNPKPVHRARLQGWIQGGCTHMIVPLLVVPCTHGELRPHHLITVGSS